MNILVCIKQVPESNQVDIDPVTGVLNRSSAESKMNPYDLYAIEAALRLRESHGGRVSVISMGPPQAESVIREAYALGADDGVLISDRRFGGSDVLATSYTLSQGIRKSGSFDLILCGQQTTDGDTAQVGPEIAEWLHIPSISNVHRILGVEGGAIRVEMDLTDDIEISSVAFPCLLTVEKEICQPRLPSYVRKTATRDRPVRILTLDDFDDRDERRYGLNGSPTQVQRIFPPVSDKRHELWEDAGELLADRLYARMKEMKFL